MDTLLINEIHQLIDGCKDDEKLLAVKELLVDEDWWDELTEEDKKRIFESEKQIADGQFYTQEQVHEMMIQWKEK